MSVRTLNFETEFAQLTKKLGKRVNSFTLQPSRDNVHDLRTMARRIEAAINLLPKKLRRKQKVRQYLAACKRVFKSTTPVRDLDTIVSKLESQRSLSTVADALTEIDAERKGLLVGATRSTKAFQKVTVPKLKKGEVSDAKIRKRRRKIVEKLDARLHEEIPTILRDSRKVAELHNVRKQCKELRYTMEVLPLKKEQRLVNLLRQWQTMLGDVRDDDITEQYVRENNLEQALSETVIDLQMSRDKTFSSFIHSTKADTSSARSKSVFSLISYARSR